MRLAFGAESAIEDHVLTPVRLLAVERGHEVLRTSHDSPRADAALYCHDVAPERLIRPAFVCLNGLDQGHARWPQPWSTLDWSRYDFGFLPGPAWMRMWEKSAFPGRSRPRHGVAMTGWPRADRFALHDSQVGLGDTSQESDQSRSIVLYAPSFECDGKQQEVVEALRGTTHELWIKHWNIPEHNGRYNDYHRWVSEANAEAERESFVRIIDPRVDLYELLTDVDLLVTDQSSTIYDAMAAGIPSLTVHGWPLRTNAQEKSRPLIPSRDVTFVARRAALREGIQRALAADRRGSILRKQERFFSAGGRATATVLDAIEMAVAAWPLNSPGSFVSRPAPKQRLVAPLRRVAFATHTGSRRLAGGARKRLKRRG